MIPSSWIAKSLAGTSAVAILMVMLVAAIADSPTEIKGGSAGLPMQAQLGSSFTDLTQGKQTADVVEAPRDTAPERAEPMPPDIPNPAAPSVARPTPPDAIQPTLPSAPEEPASVSNDLPTVAVSPETTDLPSKAQPALERIVGKEPEPGIVLSSRRPSARTLEFERVNRRPDPPSSSTAVVPQTSPAIETPSRNNASSNSMGQSSDNAQGGARSQAANPSRAGNAAASNYPAQVMARLNRVRRPSIRATGQTRVSFTVSRSGGLTNVAIAGSSGSSELDRVATQIVRSAAPFPQPPTGAQRSFTINISGR